MKVSFQTKALLSLLICLTAFGFFGFDPLSSRQPLTANQRIDPQDLADLESFQQQIKDMEERADQIEEERVQIDIRRKDLVGEMSLLSAQISVLQREIAELDLQIGIKEEEIVIMEGQIDVKTAETERRTEYLNYRLTRLYIDGNVSVIDVIMESASITDFLTRFDLMAAVVDNDAVLLQELREARAELQYQRETLEQTRLLLDEERETRQIKRDNLQLQWDRNDVMVRKLRDDKAALEAAEDEMDAQGEILKGLINGIQKKYAFMYMGSGSMGWPLRGYSRISSLYGNRLHPILNYRRFHSGIDLPAPRGTPVEAAETGVVIMAGSYGGYGNTVILDHGGNVATQYSHLYSIDVKIGDVVLKGQEIGGVGTTGLSTGNHLHFEIRIDGDTVDPLNNPTYFVKAP